MAALSANKREAFTALSRSAVSRTARSNFFAGELVEITDLEALGRLIRLRRQSLALTQQQLADRLGWVQERISVLENGKYGTPSIPSLARLAGALEMPLLALIGAMGYDDSMERLGRQTGELPLQVVAMCYGPRDIGTLGAMGMQDVLKQAGDSIARALDADSIDVFLLDVASGSLIGARVNAIYTPGNRPGLRTCT